MKKAHLFSAAKVLVSIVLIALLYRNIPLPELRAQLSDLRPAPLLPVAVLLLLNTALSALKWQILLRSDGVHLPFARLFASYLVGNFFNMFLPSTVGGDAYRVYDISRLSGQPGNTFASVFADRLAGFLALSLLALAASFPVAQFTGKPLLILIPLGVTAALGIGTFLLSRRRAMETLLRVSRIDRVPKLYHLATQCMDSWDVYRNRPDVLIRIMAISFTFQASLVCAIALLSRALGEHIPLLYFFAFVPLITLLEAIPITIFGIGLRDAGYAFFFPLAGMGQIAARLLAVLVLLVNVLYSMLGGVLIVFKPSTTEGSGFAPAVSSRLGRRAAVAAGIALLVWGSFTWPLPRHVFTGIPSSPVNTEQQATRRMVSGDHLQLLYHFWLAADMLRGRTHLFHNVYEFNTGDDDARYEPGAYYLPFSLVYAVGSWVGGRAFGWNLAGWTSVWLTFFLTWLLTRRYTANRWAALIAALFSLMLPYRWMMLLGGSPTGYAIALVPMLFLGLDLAVREERVSGGVMAGSAILLAFCADLHVFFFSVLSVPLWCVVAFAAREPFGWRDPAAYRRLALALAPAAALATVAFLLSRITAGNLDAGVMADGWPLRELHPLSPWRRGFLTWERMGVTNQIYIGFTFLVLCVTGGTVMLLHLLREPLSRWRRALVPALLLVFIAGVGALALGTDGPVLMKRAAGGDITPIVIARKLIEPYRMVRQPAKIFCLMPVLLSMLAVFPLTALLGTGKRRGWTVSLCALVAAGLWVESRAQLDPAICLLDNQQAAYAAAAEPAADGTPAGRAIVVPLWPGNSHWASVYLDYASSYHLRLVNGYRPAVPKAYIEDIFKGFESINQGVLNDTQIDDLLGRGITHVLLHEDAFPEQVSPFPVGTTLERFLDSPRLAYVTRDRGVWAFKLLPSPPPRQPTPETRHHTADTRFPSPRWHLEMERVRSHNGEAVEDRSASRAACLRLSQPGSSATVAYRARVAGVSGQRWWLRTRGNAILDCAATFGAATTNTVLRVAHSDWYWVTLPVPRGTAFDDLELSMTLRDGAADLDICLLTAGDWPMYGRAETTTLAACDLFHAGYTSPNGNVTLLRSDVPGDEVVYGPLMPLPVGEYEARLRVHSDAAPGTRLGRLTARTRALPTFSTGVQAGAATRLRFRIRENLPIRIGFRFNRAADVELRDLTLTHVPTPAPESQE